MRGNTSGTVSSTSPTSCTAKSAAASPQVQLAAPNPLSQIHSWHHLLYAPYAFGALYNHPLEGFLLDTFGAALAHSVARMTTRQGIFFFALSTAKTVDDHCGFKFPWDPFQIVFGNSADYHDIHRESRACEGRSRGGSA